MELKVASPPLNVVDLKSSPTSFMEGCSSAVVLIVLEAMGLVVHPNNFVRGPGRIFSGSGSGVAKANTGDIAGTRKLQQMFLGVVEYWRSFTVGRNLEERSKGILVKALKDDT